MKRVISALYGAVFFCSAPFCMAADIPNSTAAALLASYLSNDTDLQKQSDAIKLASLANDSAAISSGFSVKLATGTIVWAGSGSGSSFTFSPTLSASLPQADNLSMSITSDVVFTGNAQNISDTSLSLSADVISGTMLSRKVTLLKAERTLLEARRAFADGALSAEKGFYTELKELYTLAETIAETQKDLYDDKIAFEKIKTKGYAPSSSNYRAAEMEVISDKHTVDSDQHTLARKTAVFAKKCSTKFDTAKKAQDFLPLSIPAADPVDIASFSKDLYTTIESAKWTNYINRLSRNSVKNFTLAANAGYTFGNSDTGTDTADTGLSLAWAGLSLSAGIELPVMDQSSSTPAYTLSASLDPNTFRQSKITSLKNEITEHQEQLTINAAEAAYETSVITQQTSLSDILWEKQTNTETYKMYEKLADDDAGWFKAGIVTENEYQSAEISREIYRLKIIISDIELIICNNTTKLLFCRDEELAK